LKLNELDPKVIYTMCDDQLAQAPYNDTGAGIVEMCRECFGNEPGFVDPDDDERDYHIEGRECLLELLAKRVTGMQVDDRDASATLSAGEWQGFYPVADAVGGKFTGEIAETQADGMDTIGDAYMVRGGLTHYLSELSRGWWVSIGSTLLDDSGVTTDDDGNHWHDGSRDDNLYGPFTTEQEAREFFDDAPRFEVV